VRVVLEGELGADDGLYAQAFGYLSELHGPAKVVVVSDGQSASTDYFLPQFDTAGLYEVVLTVTDQHGASGVARMDWFVSDIPASGMVLGLLNDREGEQLYEGERVNLTVVYNPNMLPSGGVGTISHQWWVNGVQLNALPLSEGIWGIDLPTTPGHAQLTLVTPDASGGAGGEDRDALSFTVLNRPPTAVVSVNRQNYTEDELIVIDWGSSSDDEWDIGLLSVFVSIEGAPLSVDHLDSETFSFTHAEAGEYQLNVTVRDGDGGEGWVILPLKITNMAPTGELNCSTVEVDLDVKIVCELREIDDTPSDRMGLTIAWNISDGTSYSGTHRIEHLFSALGEQVVTVALTDDDGALFTANHSVFVNAPPVTDSGMFDSGREGDLASAVIWLGAAIVIGAILVGGGLMLLGFTRRADSEYDDDEYMDVGDEEFDAPSSIVVVSQKVSPVHFCPLCQGQMKPAAPGTNCAHCGKQYHVACAERGDNCVKCGTPLAGGTRDQSVAQDV
jgi:hypothetical protein